MIGFDCDDILFQFNKAFCSYHNRVYGTDKCVEDLINYEFSKVWNCTDEESLCRIQNFFTSPDHSFLEPFEEAYNFLKIISKQQTLCMITGRSEEYKKVTLDLINKNFPKIFSEIYFTGKSGAFSSEKVSVIEKLGIKTFVEDAPRYATSIASSGCKVIMLDRPWNRNCPTHPNITRVNSWKEIYENLNPVT